MHAAIQFLHPACAPTWTLTRAVGCSAGSVDSEDVIPRIREYVSGATIIFILVMAACRPSSGAADQSAAEWRGTTAQDGATRTVRTIGGSVWQGKGRLIQETAIGTETRGPDDLLGDVYGIDATADRIFILDYGNTTVRVYDMAGNHLQDIGRAGRGPGELQVPTDLGIDPLQRRLIVREASGILHRFTLAGEYLASLLPIGRQFWVSGTILLLRVTRDGTTMVPRMAHRRAPETDLGYIQTFVLYTIDSTGAITDSLPLPDYEHEQFILTATVNRESYRPQPVPFGPQDVWSIGWDGALITGYSAAYRFEVRYRDGRRLIIERETEPVRVLPDEREAASRRVYGIMRGFHPGWRWNGPEIPDTKPWYTAIVPDPSGRLWVLREGAGHRVEGWTEPDGWREWERNPEWVEERWFDVFEEATGRYLGRVDLPAGFLSEPEPVIDGDRLICLTEDDVGRPIVRRYRLVIPTHEP